MLKIKNDKQKTLILSDLKVIIVWIFKFWKKYANVNSSCFPHCFWFERYISCFAERIELTKILFSFHYIIFVKSWNNRHLKLRWKVSMWCFYYIESHISFRIWECERFRGWVWWWWREGGIIIQFLYEYLISSSYTTILLSKSHTLTFFWGPLCGCEGW